MHSTLNLNDQNIEDSQNKLCTNKLSEFIQNKLKEWAIADIAKNSYILAQYETYIAIKISYKMKTKSIKEIKKNKGL